MKMSTSPIAAVTAVFRTAIQDGLGLPFTKSHNPIISVSNPSFGDYQCNSAMSLFKEHKAELATAGLASPKAIGEKIMEHLAGFIVRGEDSDQAVADPPLFQKVSVAPAGFVTVTINNKWFAHALRPSVGHEIVYKVDQPKEVAVDFSSPNIAKEMHVGHLRSTIIGESVCRTLEYVGHKVHRINHLGDWGTQFGMLIEYMRDEHPDFQENPPDLTELCGFYKLSKQRFDQDPDFKKRAQQAVILLQSGDPFARSAWTMFCAISKKDFEKIYSRLDVALEDRGESYYNEMLPEVVSILEGQGLIELSEGAKVLFTEQDAEKRKKGQIPLIVVKGDGGYGYDSTDLAAIRHRLVLSKIPWCVYITDMGQEQHFHLIMKAAELAGWHTPPTTRVDHIGFGVIQGEDGKKFKTRSGDVVRLSELLDEGVERARKEIETRWGPCDDQEEKDNDLAPPSETEKQAAAEALGYSAIKYFDLKQNPATSYRFSFDKMLDPKGNTATYLMYAYARICAIFRKAGKERTTIAPSALVIETEEERALALQFLRFFEVMDAIMGDLDVHRIADYSYNLAGAFTTFYSNCRVVGDDKQESRLCLCALTLNFMAISFRLLGIKALERL